MSITNSNKAIGLKVAPVYKIKIGSYLNLPRIRKREKEFQNLIDSYESDISINQSSIRKDYSTPRLRSISKKSLLNQSIDKKNIPDSLYGLQPLRTMRSPLESRQSEQEPTNEAMFDWCRSARVPQAQAKYFSQAEKIYYWEDVQVLAYEGGKFIVQKYPDGAIKKVTRQGIKFKLDTFKFTAIQAEEPEKVKKVSPLIQMMHELKSKEGAQLPSNLQSRLKKKFNQSKHFNLINGLIKEVAVLYDREMRKCQIPKYLNQYKQRYNPQPKWMNYLNLKFHFQKAAIHLRKEVIEVQKLLMQHLNKFTFRNFDFEAIDLPLTADKFYAQFDIWMNEIESEMEKQKYTIVISIQEHLQDRYHFFQTSFQNYQESELKRILMRIDFIFCQYQLESLQEFAKSLYSEYQKYSMVNLEQPIHSKSFLRLRLVTYNKPLEQQQSRNAISKKNSIFVLEDGDMMGIEPNQEECCDLLLMPLNRLIGTYFKIQKTEIDMVCLVPIKKQNILAGLSIEDVEHCQYLISELVEQQYSKCFTILKGFFKYQYLIQPIREKMVNRIIGIEVRERPMMSQIKIQTVKEAIEKLLSAKRDISMKAMDEVKLGLFTLETKDLKNELVKGAQLNLNYLMNKLSDLIKYNIEKIRNEYNEMYKKTSTVPTTEAQLIELKLFLDEIKIAFARQSFEITQIEEFVQLFEIHSCSFDSEIMKEYYKLLSWPSEILDSIRNNKKQIDIQEKAFLQKLQFDKLEFQEKFAQTQEQFHKIKALSDYTNIKIQYNEIKLLQHWIEACYEMVSSFNQRETLFSMQVSQYQELDALKNDFKPFKNLWELANDFETQKENWLYGSFKNLNHTQIQLRITFYVNETMNLTSLFKDIQEDAAQTFARGFRRSLDSFREILWVIEALAIEAFSKKPALWREFFKDCKIQNFDPKEDFSLQTLINRGVLQVKEAVLQLSQKVEKGWNIEKRLNEMQEKLILIEIEMQEYKDTFIFKNYEEVQAQLDEQLNILTMLKSQQHIKMVIGKANHLEYKIVLIQDTLENGMKCQKHWLYLDPIFSSFDIKSKLEKESRDFRNTDASYRACMAALNKNRVLWDCIDNEKMKNEFYTNVQTLELVQKSLSKYLESKRVQFPRFYFVSDEELIEILAQTKDPHQIQKHIFKCFEGINELRFSGPHIVELHSIQGERISLNKQIDVTEGKKNGNVEQWLLELQINMKDSLQCISSDCLQDTLSSKKEYIAKWPTQCVLLANHIRWTRSTEMAIRHLQRSNLQTFLESLQAELQDTVQLVRREDRLIQKTALEAMVVMEVHAKDIVANLCKLKVNSITDFAWTSQLRYYVNEDGSYQVKMVNSVIDYGFEYLGKITRLVITSLTDRCQRTLLGALHMHYGGAPEGPAGTGKSETVKDLAKAVAMPCIVFNCSDGLNYIAMGKFFKGLASSGAWCCFDEFNRIDPEVLSVVAQQIFTIQRAIKEGRTHFVFEGDNIQLVATCAINVTMNPGYAGRSELPDNLKILFRPCAMMVPDYAMIAEIYLYSVGFEQARELSSKIVTCLKLCNEQLSAQDHYDFGMRALKAVLSTAKSHFEGSEEQICLTSLLNMNKPKFTKIDCELFMAIARDLFPGVKELAQRDLNLDEACRQGGLVPEAGFVEKCQQLQCNIEVRNGVMCIGKTYSGKSAVIGSLARARKAQVLKINPKSVLVEQLYGKLDPDTKQWYDGVAPLVIRENIRRGRVWIVFDGPVDSLWIENLNTVLDDNKKLCLTSGEILKIPQTMSMLFEVEDLSAASPATVSRCGMVYFQPLDWQLQLQSLQIQGISQAVIESIKKKLRFLLQQTFAWCAEQAQFPLYDNQNIMVASYLTILKKSLENLDENSEAVDHYLLFCLVWSVGGALDEKQRPKFNQFIIRLLKTARAKPDEYEIRLPYQDQKDFFKLVYLQGQWILWTDLQPQFNVTRELEYHEIIIPTAESIRNDYFSQCGLHFLFCGPTGTGKTISMSKHSKFQINCSGQTNGTIMQRLIETKINKRRRKGYYGSDEGHIVIFIDDLNMPLRDPQGAQPAIELLRQWMDQGGWYDLETKEFKFMCDITFIASMQPTGGGRSLVSMRYLRYFNLLYIGGFDDESIVRMLTIFVEWVYLKIDVNTELLGLRGTIVKNTTALIHQIQSNLLPTPTKSHYIYNIRDIFKVFEGMSKCTKVQNNYFMLRLWAHEVSRIFGDRLVDNYDQKIFEQIVKDIISNNGFVLQEIKNIVYVSFISGIYEEVPTHLTLKQRLQLFLDEHNTLLTSQRISLILFNMAILHVARITRILSSTFGHALLIGMGGSGRSSVSKLANFIVFNDQIQTVDARCWDDQLLTLLKEVGLGDGKSTILFTDSQFQKEYMLEDVCNLMSHGEVPHLFPPEERNKIQEELPFKSFVQICKLNIHVILCLQPVGDQFRKRLRMFPSIINCSTIDWFMSWPDEALESTASSYLPLQLVKLAVEAHHKVVEVADRYYHELRRHFYVTPTQYLQMIQTFKKLHSEKTDQARISIDRFETGIDKIIKTEQDVDKIRNILFELQPKLEKATLENLQLLNNIKRKQLEADQKRLVCEKDEQECSRKREEANQLRDLCQTQLNNVLPLLSQATEALEKISRDDMVFLKSFTKPPESAAIVMEGLCYAFQEDEMVQPKNKEAPTTQDFWDYAKKHLLNDKLIKRIKKMKIDQIRAINKAKIAKLELFVQNPLFEKEKVFNASSAAGNLAQWIRAVLATYQAVEIIEPKKAQLAEAEINLTQAELEVKIKKEALEQSLQVLQKLSVEYEKAKIEKDEIESKVLSIQAQLHRAEKLTNGLGEEKLRWKKRAQTFKSEQHSIEGDCMLSALIIAYLGVFPIQYREICFHYWRVRLRQHQVAFSDDYAIQKHLCDPITINRWLQQKLPNDQFSIDNAIILKQSTRWPLMIDPQIQANEWIKNMEDLKNLLIIDSSQPAQTVQLQLEHAIQIGYAVLLENLGQTIDPLYEPILQQKIIRKSQKSMIKFGDRLIDYAHDFRFYMTTKLSNPHYQPQICVMVTMLNFEVTQEGLVDQMLNIVVKIDEPMKEEQRSKNIQQFFLNKNKQIKTENLILQLLSESAGDLLENEELISTLQKSKEEGLEIEERLKKLAYDNQTFNQIREFYDPVASTVANLFFLIHDLSNAEPTYLWSLEFYVQLYQKAIKEATYGKSKKRIQNIIEKFTHLLYTTINRSLLEKDKLIFRFLLCLKVMNIPTHQIRTCVMGPTITETGIAMPEHFTWLTHKMWLEIYDIQTKFPEIFGWICDDLAHNKSFWDNFYNDPAAFKNPLHNLNQFHINMIVKIIKPERFIWAINYMIKNQLGKQFLENMPSTFEAFYYESNCVTPLLCLVAPGADPRQDIMTLAEKFGLQDKFAYLSLGQGQVQLALSLIRIAMESGGWVLLQNCHVANSFMPELERLYEHLQTKEMNKEFRLWLTSLPTNVIPHNVVLKALKMTYELPRGLKNNLLRTYYQQDPKDFEQLRRHNEWKNLFFSLTLFHAVLLERRKFGALGWNISYNFSQHDLEISNEQLRYFLENYSEIQWDALHYLIAETNYGGRVTDPQDRKLLKVILHDFLNPRVLSEGYTFCESYYIPQANNLKNYIDFIHQLPINDPPQLFGLHPNAEIYTAILETKNLSSVVLQLLPRSLGSSTLNPDKVVKQKVHEILEQLPRDFDLQQINEIYPIISNNSLNTVLQQEAVRYNKLLQIMRQTLNQLLKGLDGYIHLSDESLEVFNKIFDNKVPTLWSKASYPSMKLLGGWIIDLAQRVRFLNSWIQNGEPISFWLGGFFFIQSFMTGILQNYARKQRISFDHFHFDFLFQKDQPTRRPDEGFYVSGIYIDGAKFDFRTNSLEEADTNSLYYNAPQILFLPATVKREYEHYSCPLYNTAQRKGTLSTTGYSINFIKNVKIPIRQSPEHWIKRGVAMFLQLD